jgi:hypothetical protein
MGGQYYRSVQEAGSATIVRRYSGFVHAMAQRYPLEAPLKIYGSIAISAVEVRRQDRRPTRCERRRKGEDEI